MSVWETLISVLAILFFGMLFFLLGGAIVVLVVYSVKTGRKAIALRKQFAFCPILTATVRVLSKTSNTSYTRSGTRTVNVGSSYYVSFEFQDRSRKNFWIVDVAVFNTIVENEIGALSYKEYEGNTLFVGFRPQAQ